MKRMYMLVKTDESCGWCFGDAYKAIIKENELIERGICFYVLIF